MDDLEVQKEERQKFTFGFKLSDGGKYDLTAVAATELEALDLVSANLAEIQEKIANHRAKLTT